MLLGGLGGCALRDAPPANVPQSAESPRGLLDLRRDPQDTCLIWMDNKSIRYSNDEIPECGDMGRPNLLMLRNAPSALSITFQRDYQHGTCAAPGSPTDFRITLKISRASLTSPLLVLNELLQRATLENDGVVVPGLRATEVQRIPSITPTYEYAKYIDCIMIQRSD